MIKKMKDIQQLFNPIMERLYQTPNSNNTTHPSTNEPTVEEMD